MGLQGKILLTVSPKKLLLPSEKLWKCNSEQTFSQRLALKLCLGGVSSSALRTSLWFLEELIWYSYKNDTESTCYGVRHSIAGFWWECLSVCYGQQRLRKICYLSSSFSSFLENLVPENRRDTALAREKFIPAIRNSCLIQILCLHSVSTFPYI